MLGAQDWRMRAPRPESKGCVSDDATDDFQKKSTASFRLPLASVSFNCLVVRARLVLSRKDVYLTTLLPTLERRRGRPQAFGCFSCPYLFVVLSSYLVVVVIFVRARLVRADRRGATRSGTCTKCLCISRAPVLNAWRVFVK